jgi:virulence-associated protein VagC
MQQIIMDTNALRLPQEFAEKIDSDRVMIREVNEGLLLTPMPKQTGRLRGMLKGTGFSTERYFEQKRSEKNLEG